MKNRENKKGFDWEEDDVDYDGPCGLPAVGVMRQSTPGQKLGWGQCVQEDNIRDYASINGYYIKKYIYVVESGATTNGKLFKKLKKAIKSGKYYSIIVDELPRLTREYEQFKIILNMAAKKGMRVLSYYEKFHSDDSIYTRYEKVLTAYLKAELRRILETTQEAKKIKRAMGEVVDGAIPFGKTKRGNARVDSSEEQNVIYLVLHLRDEIGMSFRAIARHLNNSDIPSKLKKEDNEYVWHHPAVKNVYDRAYNEYK